jgi:hypothetical protein
MLAVHVALSFFALLAGAIVLIALCGGSRRPTWDALLLVSTALISLTGFPLAAPPGTPAPDPAVIFGVMELVVVAVAALAIYAKHLTGAWRGIYVVCMVLAVYLNCFVAVVQAFLKISAVQALAPAGSAPPFPFAQLPLLIVFVVIGAIAFRRRLQSMTP